MADNATLLVQRSEVRVGEPGWDLFCILVTGPKRRRCARKQVEGPYKTLEDARAAAERRSTSLRSNGWVVELVDRNG